MHKAFLKLFCVAIFLPAAASSQASGNVRVSGIQYEVTFDSSTSQSRTVKVAMSFTPAGSGSVSLSLPAWTPGAYEITDFSKWVSGFTATQNGEEARWDKADYDTWRVRSRGKGKITVTFNFKADSLDTAMSWSRPDFLMFNGTNIFMYPEGQGLNFPSQVSIKTHADWRVATGMNGSSVTRTYSSENYHDLVDMPFFVGRFDIDSAEVSGIWVRFATYPAGSVSGVVRSRTWEDIKRIFPPQIAVFGEMPWKTYTIMQMAVPTTGGGGLEHQNSHVDIVPPYAVGNPQLISLYAHEIFHAWNVKRLRPAELWPYRYDRPQATPLLWISEGITDYYADLSEVRGGVVTKSQFYALTAGKISEVEGTVPVALEDASLSTWIHPADGTGYIYYPKGSLAGLLLDVMIRDASDNKASLDNVLRSLYRSTYKRSAGFTNTQFWQAVRSVTGGANTKSFQDFYDKHIDGREPLPYTDVLKLAGIRAVAEKTREPRLGMTTGPDSNGVAVLTVIPGGTAASAGVKPGDVVTSVGAIDVRDPSFGVMFRQTYSRVAAGTPLEIRVRRGGQAITLQGALSFAEGTKWRVEDDPTASAKAARIREGLISGK